MGERLGQLTSRERSLVDAAAAGDWLDCSQLPVEQLSATGDPQHIIRAGLLRELLWGRCDKLPDPQGVRLRGARITGVLDLCHVQAIVGMDLEGCSFDQQVMMVNAHLPWLALTTSCIPALIADELKVDSSLLLNEGFSATGPGKSGVHLRGAHIGGSLNLSRGPS